MSEKWNVNVILCESCDEDAGNIQNIFNTIVIKEKTPPFYVVTFINGIGVGEQLELYYCIDKVEHGHRNIRAYAGKTKLERIGEAAHYSDGSIKEGTVERCCIDMLSNKISEINFPECGAYELKVYGFTDKEEISRLDQMQNKEKDKMFTNEKLFATYPFKVSKIQ